MIRGIRKTTSLRNLLTDSASGQIATLLTLAMVIVLTIVVANVKVGGLAARTTTLANTADSSALLLASQLSTKAYQLWDSLKGDPNDGNGATKKCQKSSFLSMLIGAIFAIIVAVICIIFPPASVAGIPLVGMKLMIFIIAMAASAGAIGGAVGAVASGTDILQGAAQGAAIGAAIGGIACGVVGIMNPSFFATLPTAGLAFMATEFGLIVPTVSYLSAATLWGAIGTGVFGLGSNIYTAVSAASALDKSLSQAAKALNGLPEKDSYREQVFLNALSQAVDDDPNLTSSQYVDLSEDTDCDGEKEYYCMDKDLDGDKENCDPHDANRNGDKNEAVSYFSYWWERRVKELKKVVPDRELMTNDFVFTDQSGIDGGSCAMTASRYNGYGDGRQPLSDFRNSAKAIFTVQGREVYDGKTFSFVWLPGSLYRRGLTEWRDYLICSGCEALPEAEPAAGTVVQVAEAMEGIGVNVSFYVPGLTTRIGSECADKDCLDEPYWDEMEAVIGELAGFADIVDALKEQDYQKLASTFDSWVRMFYDPDIYAGATLIQENRDDYYDTLNALVNGEGEFRGLKAWKDEIVSKKMAYGNNFPQCEYELVGEEIINAPCKVSGDCAGAGCVITTDSDADDDEFDKSTTAIDGIIADIGVYRDKAENYYESMNDAYSAMETDYGGRNPVIYKWADSRCPKDSGDLDGDEDREETLPCHSVSVEVSDFRVPWIKKKKSGGFLTKKICLILTDYSDGSGANTWVTVSRADLASQAVGGTLGSWTYCGSGGSDCAEDESLFGQRMFKTSRISRAKYSYNMVGIASTDK